MLKRLLILALMLVILSACGPTESSITVSDPWARAATVSMMMDDTSTDMTTNNDDSAAMDSNDDMTEGESSDDMAMTETNSTMHVGAVSAAYMVLENAGAADTLISAATDAAGVVEIHTVIMEDDVMRMRPVEGGIEIPKDGRITLEPGGFHIMLMDLQEDLIEGDSLSITLLFESGKTIDVDAEIRVP